MPAAQITSFRLLHFVNRSPLNTPLHFSPFLSPLLRRRLPFSLSTAFSFSPPRSRRNLSSPRFPSPAPNFKSRGKSSLAERKKGTSPRPPPPMADSEKSIAGFNKRRAEGRDKSDKPKTLEKKVRKLNPINTISYVQIIGTGMDTQDTSSSVLLFFDNQRFIFNAGEGLQRFCTEHKIKLSKIDHIFLSRVCSETAGGLPGLLLTLAGEVGTCVNIWGPSDLDLLVKAMKLFVPNAAMVHTKSFGPLQNAQEIAIWDKKQFSEPIELINDEVVKISAVLLQPSYSMGLGEGRDEPLGSLGTNGNNGTAVKPGELSVVYVCELPKIQGKFHPEKAKALGLKPGPKYRDLQLHKSVKSDRLDIMVHPSDVMDPPIPGPIVLLVDCPTESHLQHLLSSSSLDAYYANHSVDQSESAKKVNCVIHLSPSSVIKSSQYQEWMSRFGDVQHIVAGHERKNAEIPILKSSARVAARLNFLCPQFFPASGFWPVKSVLDHCSNSSDEEFHGISAENLMKFHLRPYTQLGLSRSCVPNFTPHEEMINQLLEEIPGIQDAANQVRGLWIDTKKLKEEPCLNYDNRPDCLENIMRDDMEITLLGTGSSQPSKYRNVSSIYINVFSKGSLLFDCGEGTLGQLKRRFGLEGADNAVRNLRCIWISHIHADHHTGLARILALRRDLLKGTPHEPLLVVGPRQLKGYLDAYQRLEDLDMQFLDCKHTTEDSLAAYHRSELNADQSSLGAPPNSENTRVNVDDSVFARGSRMESYFRRPGSPADRNVAFPILRKLKKSLQEGGMEALVSFPVVHCPQAFGVVLKASERINSVGKVIPGWKIVYSGDTRPCPELIKASRGATVLIHEATFEDGMVDEAVAKNHSTTSEAIEAGESAGVYRIILTHFSQRYPKIPVFNDTHMHNTSIGFDMMSINMADLPILPKVLPYLKLLFRDDVLAEEESADGVEEVAGAAS